MEKPPTPEDRLITNDERQKYCVKLYEYIATTAAMGANDSEVEAVHLLQRLQNPEENVTLCDVKKIFASLGNPDDKNTNYH